MSDPQSPAWQEEDSRLFVELGRIYTPRRDELEAAILDLIPAGQDEPFLAVDIGTGQGWLSAAILSRFSASRVHALDGSPTMLEAASGLLAPHGDRATFGEFLLQDFRWIDVLEGAARVFVSSLVIHHLDGRQKQELYRRLYDRLEPGGGLIVADIVEATSESGRRLSARMWNEAVRRQSVELLGDERAYERFVADGWNLFEHPDPEVDQPSTLPDHLHWLREAGFTGVDAWWVHAGHALYGGYKG